MYRPYVLARCYWIVKRASQLNLLSVSSLDADWAPLHLLSVSSLAAD
jgi:hypothetical protein